MKQKDHTGIIPANYTGKAIEAEAWAEMKDDTEAKKFYGKDYVNQPLPLPAN